MTCERYEGCDLSCPAIKAEPDKSICVTKTNTLHQFDTANVIGVGSPVGKIPILFYVRTSCDSGYRGLAYYGERDTVCFMFPENAHADWCRQPYSLKYDAVEPWQTETERGFRRNFGILDLWVSVWRRWYNGRVMYRPCKKIQGCSDPCDGYPREKQTTVRQNCYTNSKPTTEPKSCGCGR